MAPRADKFQTTYASESTADDINSAVDDSLHSFMDSDRDNLFETETINGEEVNRGDVVAQVRVNILRRLDEENRGSRGEAEAKAAEHDVYTRGLMTDLAGLQATVRSAETLQREKEQLENARQNDHSAFSFLKFRGTRIKSHEKSIAALGRKRDDQVNKLVAKSRRWQAIRADYAKTSVKKRYKTYDGLAKSWYELTHSYALSALPENATEEQRRAATENRTIPAENAKNIVEYTGIYNEMRLLNAIGQALANPSVPIDPAAIEKVPYKESRNNGEGANRLYKSHKKILMLSETDQSTGKRVRYKFNPDFLGVKAKSQFVAADSEATELDNTVDQQQIHAESAHLESDRRDINNRFLFSENSAEILHANLKRNKQTVYGFLMNGEFLTDDSGGEDDGNGGERVSGKQDMKFFGRRNWDKQEKAEKLRVAIRTSPFFQHVNARTIQYYAGYNADSDYIETINKAIAKRWTKEQENGTGQALTPNSAAGLLEADPNALDNIPDSVRGPALAEYLKITINEDFEGNPLDDPVLRHAIEAQGKILPVTCLILLSAEDPVLWDLARNIILRRPSIVKSRTRIKMKYLPERGTMMRMGLLEELFKYGGSKDIKDEEDEDEESDILSKLGIPTTTVMQEELDSKRGTKNWIKRNLLNGKLIKEALGLANAGTKFADQMSDIREIKKRSGETETDEEREEREERESARKDERDEKEFWFSYGETCAEANNIIGILGAAGVAGLKFGLGEEIGARARDIGFQVFDFIDIINSVIDIVKAIKKFFRKKTDEEKEKEANGLKDLDAGKARSFLSFLSKAIGLVNSIRDIASYHVAEEESWGAVVNKAWGELLAFRGPIDFALNTAQNVIAIITDIIEIVTATKRIGRIERADQDIESAITLFNEEPDNQPRIMLAGEAGQQREQRRQLGKAAKNNAQAQYFMALTKGQSRKSRSQAGWDIAAKTLAIGKDTFASFVDPSGSIIQKTVSAVLSLGPKLVQFMGWTVGKLKYDKGTFNDNIAAMLGDKAYAKTPYFDKVLKRETGIVSSSYLSDIARIFMSIDTHVLINKENKTGGEKQLAKTVVGTLFGNVTDANYQDIELSDMLKYAGFSEDSDWRTLLRNAISGK